MITSDVIAMRDALVLIRRDMAADVERYEGAEMTGRNVSTWFGNLSAAISALAGIVDVLLCELAGEKAD